MQDAINKIIKQEQEKNILDEMINIYNGKYKDYVEYREAKGNYCDFLISPDTFYYLLEKSVYNIIKEKRDSAERESECYKNSLYEYQEVKGEISAYNDVLSLIEGKR